MFGSEKEGEMGKEDEVEITPVCMGVMRVRKGSLIARDGTTWWQFVHGLLLWDKGPGYG